MNGKVKFFNVSKGYGFIVAEDGEYFFHVSAVDGKVDKDDLVTFEPSKNDKGLVALNVKKL
jgi:CspA family cold shock protein